MKAINAEKIDFSKTHKELYTATSKVKEIQADKATFLSVKGVGAPGGAEFERCIGLLFGLVYTTKFGLKFSGGIDFAISRLECLWPEDPCQIPREKWPWQLLIRIPDELKAADLKPFRKELLEKKGLDTSEVERWSWKEGPCLQVMHVGQYDQVGNAFNQLGEYAESKGLKVKAPGHEIYISDPRRVPPERLKTIVRMPVEKKK
jgi:hypothetical protein